MRELWNDVDFWAAPGGASVEIHTLAEVESINRVLRNTSIMFDSDRHRWLFHVHLM